MRSTKELERKYRRAAQAAIGHLVELNGGIDVKLFAQCAARAAAEIHVFRDLGLELRPCPPTRAEYERRIRKAIKILVNDAHRCDMDLSEDYRIILRAFITGKDAEGNDRSDDS